MSAKIAANVAPGFSLTNRWLLYTSLMFTPAQALSGIGSHCPSNVGFLAYNYWQQYIWFSAARSRELHALSLLPVYLNMMYSATYMGGVQSGNLPMGILLGVGSVGLILMNTVTAWISFKTNLPEGDGVYQFFFFGWRTVSKKWRIVLLVWEISNTIVAAAMIIMVMYVAIITPRTYNSEDVETSYFRRLRVKMLFWGSIFMLFIIWPFILWVELIVKRNNIVSETDMISVYLFVAQVGAMVLPSLFSLCFP